MFNKRFFLFLCLIYSISYFSSSCKPRGIPTSSRLKNTSAEATFPIFDPSYNFLAGKTVSTDELNAMFPIRNESDNDGTSELAMLHSGDDSFAMRMKVLKNAKKSVRIQALIFKGDESGQVIAETLLNMKKANPNLDIKIIVDSLSNLWPPKTQEIYFNLRDAKIDIEGYEFAYLYGITDIDIKHPYTTANYRYHEKMWIIDGEDAANGIAIVGGMNIANEYFRTGGDDGDDVQADRMMRWRDHDAALRGPIVKDVMRLFDRNVATFKKVKEEKGAAFNPETYWNYYYKIVEQNGLGSDLACEIKDVVKKVCSFIYTPKNKIQKSVANIINKDLSHIKFVPTKARFLVSRTRPEFNETDKRYIYNAYIDMVKNAKESIEIENAYFLLTNQLKDFRVELKEAVKRGIDVTIVTNSEEVNDLPQLTLAARLYYQDLLSANNEAGENVNGEKAKLRIFEWNKQGEGTVHAKYAVFDRRAGIIGSYNLDPRSLNLDSESAIVFEEESLGSAISDHFRTATCDGCGQEFTLETIGIVSKPDTINKLGKVGLSWLIKDQM